VGKSLVLIGVAIALLGLAVMAGLPLGRLPGDIVVRRESFTFYFPLTTAVLLSVVLTLLLALFRK